MQTHYHIIVELRKERTTSQSRFLMKGKVVPNEIPEYPDVCPLDCKKIIEPHRMLVTRHHADKNIGLFYCHGCPHLLFKSLIVPRSSEMPFSAEPPMESALKEKIAPLTATSRGADNIEHGSCSPTAIDADFMLLSEKLSKKLHTRGFDLICTQCNKPIEVGDLYHRLSRSRKTKKLYHKGCWENLLH